MAIEPDTLPRPYTVVNGPRFTPLPYGLLSVAQIVDDADMHWQAGTLFQPDTCQPANARAGVVCTPGSGLPKVPLERPPLSAAQPFHLYAWLNCAPVGWGDDLGELEAATIRALDAGEDRSLGRTFWTGQPDQGDTIHPHLDADEQVLSVPHGPEEVELQSAAIDVGAGDIQTALGLLEGALADCYGGQGVIHAPRGLLTLLGTKGVKPQGPQLQTVNGNLVAGYGISQDPLRMFATGAVMVRRSPVQRRGQRPSDYVGRHDNSTVFVVERTYVIDWDCCHFVVTVIPEGEG